MLGFWAVSLWGRSLASFDRPFETEGGHLVRTWAPGLSSTVGAAESLSAIILTEDSPSRGEHAIAVADSAAIDRILVPTNRSDRPLLADGEPARQVALHRMGVSTLLESPAPSVNFVGTPIGAGTPWSGVSESFLAFAGNGEGAGRSPQLLAASHGDSAPLSFDPLTGQLAIRTDAGDHTVREEIAADGFVAISLQGAVKIIPAIPALYPLTAPWRVPLL